MRQPKYRLSPNEVERLVKEDQERRRKLRLIQVREQSKVSAALIRADVKKEKERLLSALVENVKEQLDAEKEEKTQTLKQKYENTLRTIGESHRAALKYAEGENATDKHLRQMQQETSAQQRFKHALDRQRQEEAERDNQRTKHILARLAALDKEKLRAAEVANLPPPPPDITVSLDTAERRRVPLTDMKAFATTRYHIPDYHVVKANAQEQELYDAKSQAEDVDLKLKQDLEEKKRSGHEMLVRARIRGNQALKKEMLKHEYADFLKDLSLLQKQDRRLRQKKLSEIPSQVFLPPEQCLAERQERQKELESKFDEMFTTKSDEQAIPPNSVKPVWNCEERQDSTDSTSHVNPTELSIPMSKINPALRDMTNFPQPSKELQFQKPETVLKQLMNRIKEQRGDLVASGPSLPLAASGSTTDVGVKISSAETSQPHGIKQASWENAKNDQEELKQHPQEKLADMGSGRNQKSAKAGEIVDSDLMIQELKQRINVIEFQKKELTLMLQGQKKAQLLSDPIRQQPLNRDAFTPGEVYLGHDKDARDDSKGHTISRSNNVARSGDSAEVATQLPLTSCYGSQQDVLWKTHYFPADEILVPVGLKAGNNLARDGNQTNREYYRNDLIKGSLVESKSNFVRDNQHVFEPVANFERFTLPSLGYASMDIESGNINKEQGMWTDKGEDPVGSLLREDNLMRKVREYTERAVDKRAGLDASMIQKVRQYQQNLLQTHEDRKQYLADIRADIESRRQELKSTSHTKEQPLVSANTSEHWELPLKGIQNSMHQRTQSLVSGNEAPHAQAANAIGSNLNMRPIQTMLSDLSKYNKIFAELQTNKSDLENANVKGSALDLVGPAAEDNMINVSAGVKPKIDRVRKSLSFDDAEEGVETGNISWKDFMSFSNQNSSPGLSEYSLPTSGGEESGSPWLAARPRKWLENMMVNKSGINGSDLLAVAQEQQLGFEDRHRELQQQLKDIEQQKEAIMKTYMAGQLALKERQASMKCKLAAASVLPNQDQSQSKGSVKTVDKKIFQDVKVVPNKAASTSNNEGRNINMKPDSAMDNFSKCSPTPPDFEGPNSSLLLGMNESRNTDISGLFPDRTSGATLGNISSNSFLAEISFHNIRTSNDISRHTSAFQAVQPSYSYSNSMTSVAKVPKCVPRLAETVPRYKEPIPRPVNSQPLHSTHTWASILLSECHISQPSIDFQTIGQTKSSLLEPAFKQSNQTNLSKHVEALSSCNPSTVNKTLQTTKPSDNNKLTNLTVTLKEINPSQALLESSLPALPSVLFQSSEVSDPLSSTQSCFTHEDSYHQPHELSTILEVDTPGPSSTLASSKITNSPGFSHSSHALGQDNLSTITSVNPFSGIRVDLFKDLPFTFLESRAASIESSGAVYNLATVLSHKSPVSETPPVDRFLSLPFDGKKTASARRSLNFAEDLFETPMPSLVELTPCKSPNSEKEDSGFSRFVELKPDNFFYSPGETAIISQADTGKDVLDIGDSGINTQKPNQISVSESSDLLIAASEASEGDVGNCQKQNVKTDVGSSEEVAVLSHSTQVEGNEHAQVELTELSALADTSAQMSIASLGLTSTCDLSDDLQQMSISKTAAGENSEHE